MTGDVEILSSFGECTFPKLTIHPMSFLSDSVICYTWLDQVKVGLPPEPVR